MNLKMINSLSQTFGLPIGLSDHSTSYFVPTIAVALGACIIEKHVTFNKSAKGPDHFFALEEKELNQMVLGIREAEKTGGNYIKQPAIKNERKGFGRRIVLKKNYRKGETIKISDLIIKRADAKGILASDIKKVIGLKVSINIKSDEILKWKYFK